MSGHQDSSNRAPRARTGTAATAPTVAGGRVRGMAVGLWAVVGTAARLRHPDDRDQGSSALRLTASGQDVMPPAATRRPALSRRAWPGGSCRPDPVSYTHLRAHETVLDLV